MPVWKPDPASDEVAVPLDGWQVVQLPSGDRHVVGTILHPREGRVSGAIVTLDSARLVCTTRSGESYRLTGRPGGSLDADYVWNHWRASNEVQSWTMVSDEVWFAHLLARGVG